MIFFLLNQDICKKISMNRFFYFFILLLIVAIHDSCESDPYRQGAILYENFCANCHGSDGNGLGKNIPPLVGSEVIKDPITMGCIIRNGLSGEITVKGIKYNEKMPAVTRLSDFEIANVINYIQQKWGNQQYVQINTLQEGLKNCK